MEETDCEIISGARTTLAVKRQKKKKKKKKKMMMMTDGAKVSRGRPNESASMIVEGLHVFFLFVFFCFLFFLQKPVFG